MADLIPDISHTTSWPEMSSPRPHRWERRGQAARADRSAMEASTVLPLSPGEKKPPIFRSSEAPWLLRPDGFFHKAAPWPWQAVSETSVTSGRLQEEACKSLEAALCSLQEKLRAKFISPWWRASTLWCWEMKGHTGLVSSRCQTLWPLLTSSCCLSFQSTIHQIGQRKEKSTIKHLFPHYMTSK